MLILFAGICLLFSYLADVSWLSSLQFTRLSVFNFYLALISLFSPYLALIFLFSLYLAFTWPYLTLFGPYFLT